MNSLTERLKLKFLFPRMITLTGRRAIRVHLAIHGMELDNRPSEMTNPINLNRIG